MIRLNLFDVDDITLVSSREHLELNIRELQYNSFYISALSQEIDERIQVVAKKLLKDMEPQTYEMLNVPGMFRRWEEIKKQSLNNKYVW